MWKRMERYILFPVLFFLLAGLCACQKEKEVIKEKEPDFVYPAEEVTAFGLDAENNLYTFETDEKNIHVYDKDGVRIREIPAEEGKYTSLCVADGSIYAVVSVTSENGYESSSLVEIIPADGSRRILYEDPEIWAIDGVEFINGSLYFMKQIVSTQEEEARLSDWGRGYLYSGEKLMEFNIAAGEAEEIPVERLKGVCKKDEESLWLYAYDIDKREFYFAEYNAKTGIYGEKYYGGDAISGSIQNLAYDGDYKKLLYVDGGGGGMLAVEPEDANSRTSLFETEAEVGWLNSLRYQDGYTYFLSGGKVTRVRNSNYIRNSVPLKIYSCTGLFYELPEGTGFNLNLERVDEETMAMVLMAGDSDYDMLILSTTEPLACQIRRIGAYEPLNKVEGVAGYLDTGFDYVREAATAENGAVWMLPFEVACKMVLYNPEVCARYGIDLESGYTYEKMADVKRTLEEAEETNPAYYDMNPYQLFLAARDQYMADYAVINGSARFDTELFRRSCELIKAECSRGSSGSQYSRNLPQNVIRSFGDTEEQYAEGLLYYFSNLAVVVADKSFLSRQYSLMGNYVYRIFQYDFFKVKPFPPLEEGKPQKSMAEAVFLVLNPKSRHLEEAKEYLSVLAERLGSEESIYRTKELSGTYNALEQSIHALYGDARIVFPYPGDVFSKEYAKYLRGEKALDEVIPELERKLNTYLRE